ncbi:MAG TPA: ABC transporter permease subunit [Deltaproteobacteria bacterium]|jgi:spermidine/putrescine transport system permease protein|nr:ABC transporter permease subunit [Deltaproteobacteria bacterium]
MDRKSRFRNFAVGSTFAWITIFVVIPYLIVIAFSFLTRNAQEIVTFTFTFTNYRDIFSPVFLKVCESSFILALGTTVITLVFAYPFAFFLTRIDENIRRTLILLMIIPFWTSSLIRTYALIILLKANGIVNSFLMSLGLIDEPLTILYTQVAVFIGMVYTLLPFMILPLYASLQKLDRRLIEAARDLGATSRSIFFYVILPLTLPGIIAGSTMVFLPALGLFYIPDLLGGARSMLIGNFIKDQFLTTSNWPLGSAASVILTLLMVLLLVWYFISSSRAHSDGMEAVR